MSKFTEYQTWKGYRLKRREILKNMRMFEGRRNLVSPVAVRPDEYEVVSLERQGLEETIEHMKMLLRVAEGTYLIDLATELGITGTPSRFVYEKMRESNRRDYFDETGTAVMKRMIRSARRENRRYFEQVWAPWIAILISVAALILSVVALRRG